jgi:hypothetical protein
MSDWFDDLTRACDAAGQQPLVLDDDAGASLLAVRPGARVLACRLPGVDHNLFFGTTVASGPTGGDRLWIAPEVGWFWPSLDEARRDPKGTADVPPQIDPGDYRLTRGDDAVQWTGASLALVDVRTHRDIEVTATRAVRLIEMPHGLPDGLTSISYEMTNVLQATAGDPLAVAGAWSILQVPPTGTLHCPVTTPVMPRSYYEPFGDRHVQLEDASADGSACVRFLIDGNRRVKMGIRPEHTTGRMGYHRVLPGGQHSLIVRAFAALPGMPYCDIPRDHRADQRLGGDALQAYNDDGDAFPGTTFGEMEHHGTAVSPSGPASSTDRSVTHVLVGPGPAIAQAASTLLGVGLRQLQAPRA